MEREEMIDFLIDRDFRYITECANGPELLDTYLRSGFTGYSNYTDAELVEEIGAV